MYFECLVYEHYGVRTLRFLQNQVKYGEQTDNSVYNFNAVDNSMHGLIIHTIRSQAIAVVVEQGGGVRTLQKFGLNINQRNNSV